MAGLMTVELLKECMTEYSKFGYDGEYFAYLQKIQQLKDDCGEELARHLIEFLNTWGQCRIPYAASLPKALKDALRDIQPFLIPTRQFTIEDADLSAVVPVGEQQNLQLAHIAHICLDRLSALGKRFSGVASAKALHMLSPTFFVMWDRTISEGYRRILSARGCDGWFYAHEFLPRMQREAANLIEDGTKEGNRSREQFLDEVRSGFGAFPTAKTVAKVVDEFNYIMFTRGKFAKLPESQLTSPVLGETVAQDGHTPAHPDQRFKQC